MCSVDPDEETLMTKPSTEYEVGSDIPCRKCKSKPIHVVLKKTDPYCGDCFLAYLTHKFRSCIGKHKSAVPAGSEVLVAVSGGMSSSALMHLVHDGVTLKSLKKLRITPYFIHVDLSGTNLPNAVNSQDVLDSATAFGYPCYYFPIEALYSKGEKIPLLYENGTSVVSLRQQMITTDASDKLNDLMSTFSSNQKKEKSIVKQMFSAKESLVRTLTKQSLNLCCSSLNISKMFVGTSASQIASIILSSVAEGRGANVTENVTFLTSDPLGFDICRPMREILEEEVKYFLTLRKIEFHADVEDKDTIVGCTQSFLSNLQNGFPSTVPTVFRIGDKLQPYEDSHKKTERFNYGGMNSNQFNEDQRCTLCNGILDCYQPHASALHAILLSEKISTSNSTSERNDNNGLMEFDDLIENNHKSGLCNGCRITTRYMNDSLLLPPHLSNE